MAEKKDKKESKPAISLGALEMIVILVILFGLGGMLINWISKHSDVFKHSYETFVFAFINFYAKFVVFSAIITTILIILIYIYVKKEAEVRQKLMNRVLPSKKEVEITGETNINNPKWKLVEDHMNSDDPSKWRLAILEADIMLSELLDSLGLPGEGIAEKLKSISPDDFENIEEAWEAHKIRNAIAHQGSDFLLTHREAKRVISLYEQIFAEFEII